MSDLRNYDWHDPEDVLVVHDSEFNVIAYGTPKESDPQDEKW